MAEPRAVTLAEGALGSASGVAGAAGIEEGSPG